MVQRIYKLSAASQRASSDLVHRANRKDLIVDLAKNLFHIGG